MRKRFKSTIFIGSSLALTAALMPAAAFGQTALPQVTVETTKKKPPPKRAATRQTPAPAAPATATTQTPEQAQQAANRTVVQQTQNLDQRRDTNLLPKAGATTYQLTQQDIATLPQGERVPVRDVQLLFPGVYQDSTASGDLHVRNDHANVQYRINGILLPDGVSGFAQILDTSFIGSIQLLTGALPAQYGLHTTGVFDIITKSGAALAGGEVGIYGGSHDTISPYFNYGGVAGQTEYFASGRFQSTGLGLENPTASNEAIHDIGQQGRFFGYTSTLLDPNTRFVTITGMSENRYQIPNNPGQPTNNGGFAGANGTMAGGPYSAFGFTDFNTANINQNQYEKNAYAVAAWQHSEGDLDWQFAYYSRYSDLHFIPDPIGDLVTNNVASDVFRSTFLNGVSGDVSYRVNDQHTVRGGLYTNVEHTEIRNNNMVEMLDGFGNAMDAPFNILDTDTKTGYQLGGYVQDEFRVTDKLTFNYGLRFDQIYQYVDANQLSPRASATYKPWWGTTLHAGYARYFTPPEQVLGRTVPNGLFDNTTGAPPSPLNEGSIEPERSNVYDVGIVQEVLPRCPEAADGMVTKAPKVASNCPSLQFGLDAYYKHAKDLIDDGQFGQAYVLTAFNYAYGENYGVEWTTRYREGNLAFDMNWAYGRQKATTVVSNQSLFSTDDLAFIASHWINTDHDQTYTGSALVAYRFDPTWGWLDGTVVSATGIFGSGLRTGADNVGQLPSYYQINLGASHEFAAPAWWFINNRPITVRFDVVNVTDDIYLIRSGSGIGVFASQYGPRRGYFLGLSQKLGDPGPFGGAMPTKAPPMYSWTGVYSGAHFGGAFNIEDATIGAAVLGAPVTNSLDSSGALGGLQLGYNWHFAPHWLAGVEGEISWTSVEARANYINTTTAVSIASDHNKSYETLAGRFGYVDGGLLTYVKAGGAWADIQYILTAAGAVNAAATITPARSGWTVSTGIEYKLSPAWSAKAEYSFLDFGTETVGSNLLVPGDTLTAMNQVHEVKAGVNYHWGQ